VGRPGRHRGFCAKSKGQPAGGILVGWIVALVI
jgi:hypothetical protein